MTPAELAVERDALLQGGRSVAEVERMQRAAEPGAFVSREHALDAIIRMSNWQHGYGPARLATTADCVRCLEYPHGPVAASDPEDEARELDRHVNEWRIARHVCTEPRADCWCAAYPGAGAG